VPCVCGARRCRRALLSPAQAKFPDSLQLPFVDAASLQLFALAHAVVVAAGGADKSSVQPAFSAPLHGLGFARKHAMRRVQVNGGSTDKGSVRERPVQRRFCQQLQAVAREEWSITGGNTALQSLMGTGAGVATEDVCTLRHDKEGTGIELWHGSFGWFDFMAYDGAPVILSDTWGIQIERPTQVPLIFCHQTQYYLFSKNLHKCQRRCSWRRTAFLSACVHGLGRSRRFTHVRLLCLKRCRCSRPEESSTARCAGRLKMATKRSGRLLTLPSRRAHGRCALGV